MANLNRERAHTHICICTCIYIYIEKKWKVAKLQLHAPVALQASTSLLPRHTVSCVLQLNTTLLDERNMMPPPPRRRARGPLHRHLPMYTEHFVASWMAIQIIVFYRMIMHPPFHKSDCRTPNYERSRG